MRLTNSMISGNYLKGLNKNLKELNGLNTKIASSRQFIKMSEDPATALKAFRVRKNLSRIQTYQSSLSESQGLFDEAEISISTINDITTNTLGQVLQGITGTTGESDRKVVAETLRMHQEMILSAANVKFADKYIFGGKGVETMPFGLDASGKLQYNGQNVDTGTFSDEKRYIDIGIGLSVDAGGNVAAQSAFNTAYSGTELLGTGVDANGIPNNLYNLIGVIAEKIENGDLDDIHTYTQKLEAKSDDIRMQYVGLGEKSNYISFFTNQMARDKIAASTKQTEIEVLSLDEGIIQFSEQELVYNACLQMGTKILQPSLLDYLR